MPWTRIERGPLTGQAVQGNRHQIAFDSKVVSLTGDDLPGPRSLTWLLLHYFDEDANELSVELSVPVEFTRKSGTDNERGTVTAFDPRLILPAIPLAPVADVEDEDEGDDEIDISVPRRR